MGILIECKELVDSDLTTIDQLSKLFLHWKRSSIQKKLAKTLLGSDTRFIAVYEGKIIGHLKVVFGKGIHGHRAEFLSLVVDPAYRNSGVGTSLMEYALKNLPKEISLVTLSSDSKNKVALKLYSSLGFKKYGTLKRASLINGKFIDNHLMKKDI